jgi:predicted nucleic acid-binding protein
LILATAVSGGADYLVTGDKQLLKLGSFEGVRIVDSRAFLEILDREAAEIGE